MVANRSIEDNTEEKGDLAEKRLGGVLVWWRERDGQNESGID